MVMVTIMGKELVERIENKIRCCEVTLWWLDTYMNVFNNSPINKNIVIGKIKAYKDILSMAKEKKYIYD